MAKNFSTVSGTVPETGEIVHLDLSSKEVDEYEELFGIKPAIGMVYKGQRHVVQIQCPRGVVPNDAEYGAGLSYVSISEPRIVYIDIKSGEMASESPKSFVAWLGKDWTADEAEVSEETKKEEAALLRLGAGVAQSMKAENKADEDDEPKDKDKPNWKPTKRRKSKK